MKEQKVETVKLDNYEINDPDKVFDLFKTSFEFFFIRLHQSKPSETSQQTNPPGSQTILATLELKEMLLIKKWEVSQNDFQLFDKYKIVCKRSRNIKESQLLG